MLAHRCQLHWDESELDLCAAVTVDLRRTLEAHLGEELIKDVFLRRLVIVVLDRCIKLTVENVLPTDSRPLSAATKRAHAQDVLTDAFHF